MDKTELIGRLNRLLDEVATCEEAVRRYTDDPQVLQLALFAAQNMAGFIETVLPLLRTGPLADFTSATSQVVAEFRTAMEGR